MTFRELGRLGGLKGGKARAAKLSAERRKEIAALGGKAKARSRAPAHEPTEAELDAMIAERRATMPK